MELLDRAHINPQTYKELYEESTKNPEAFWKKQSERLYWRQDWEKLKEVSFTKPVSINWFQGGKLNVCENCVDRHVETHGEETAIIWEPDDPKAISRKFSYRELRDEVAKFANILKKHKVKKGDRVTIYMPMIPEAAFAMLACSRIGAVHSVIFGGFSPQSIAGRIHDCESDFVITANEGLRAGKSIPLKANVDKALEECPNVRKVLVVQRSELKVPMKAGRDLDFHTELKSVDALCPCETMDAEDPLFILYTSGSTGKPKGILHTTGGYLTYAAMTHEYVFDYSPGQIYWCTADVGWITGHSYIVYGPLANRATTVMFEGVPNYPTPSRHWEIVDKYSINIYYTAPTAIRALMCSGDGPVKKTSRKSLRLLGSVGEPLNPEAFRWYEETVGNSNCPIVDTWWQTETGGILLSALPGATLPKGGSVAKPLFGIQPAIVNEQGQLQEGETQGDLVILDSWPGQARSIYGDHARFEATYFEKYPGKYFSGDGATRDKEDYFWITGRVDDVINVSGHRLGSAEVESALVAHEKVSEAAVIGIPHEIKGQGIYAFVTLMEGQSGGDALKEELNQWVRKEIGPICSIDMLHFTPALPKTRSGKIMRRILRKISVADWENLGDTSTLANPEVVQKLVESSPHLDT